MTSFKTRIKKISKTRGPVILANDYNYGTANLEQKTIANIKNLHRHLCGIKLNFHLLLPLGAQEIKKITKVAGDYGLITIADMKLNDIGNTNMVTTKYLWNLGFDCVIVNPIMGTDSLHAIINHAHKQDRGVITLCHMSAPEAQLSYDLNLKSAPSKLYKLFLKWALAQKADGIIAGATFPDIIKYCKKTSKGKLPIYSPGVGTQGGDPKEIVSAGTDYLIVGRTILNAKNPLDKLTEIQRLALDK